MSRAPQAADVLATVKDNQRRAAGQAVMTPAERAAFQKPTLERYEVHAISVCTAESVKNASDKSGIRLHFRRRTEGTVMHCDLGCSPVCGI